MKRKREDHNGGEDVEPVAVLEITSPQGPAAIGPTPQRDGIVLGLFDLLPAGTPSRKRTALADVEPNVLQTPSKGVQEATSESSFESRLRAERTPQSSGKRFLLNQFATPKRLKLDEPGTPSSTLRNLATPSFLRRDNVLAAIDEIDEATPRPAPWKRRPLGRSLSAMIQAMRKDEDDRLDEEADIMRELEMEEEGIPMPRKPKVVIQVEDSQAQMPLGPDRGHESEEESDEAPDTGANGKSRPWKKKGLKRQTRRVISECHRIHGLWHFVNHLIVRPNFAKPKPPPQASPEVCGTLRSLPRSTATADIGQ
jgi:26S proteasome regulatory subunit N12